MFKSKNIKLDIDSLVNTLSVYAEDKNYIKYEERLFYELEVIKKMGFSGYFLIVAEIVNWARQANIRDGVSIVKFLFWLKNNNNINKISLAGFLKNKNK